MRLTSAFGSVSGKDRARGLVQLKDDLVGVNPGCH